MEWSRFLDDKHKGKLDEDKLLNTLYAEMFTVAYAKMKNKADALDVVQESWVKILKKIDTLRDEEKLVQWAKRIASNTANNVLRRKIVQHEMVEERLVSAEKTDESVEYRYLRGEIQKSISMLDAQTRSMLVYKYYYGWKDRQIAEKMGIPLGTVKARLHRGRLKLRIWLADMVDEEGSY